MSMFTEILNPFMNVRNQIKQNGRWVDKGLRKETHGNVSALNKEITFNTDWKIMTKWNTHIIIDAFEFSTASPFIYPLLFAKAGSDGDYAQNLFHIIRPTGRSNATVTEIYKYGSTFLESEQFKNEDDSLWGYIVKLKAPIHLPSGCQLVIRTLANGSGDTLSYKLQWREIVEND